MTLFGIGLATGFDGVRTTAVDPAKLLADAKEADAAGLDLVTVTDHPYSTQLDPYALLGYILGATTKLTGAVTVTNLPCRPAPVLARTVSGLSTLSGGRIVLGLGVGAFWDQMVRLGVPRRTPGEAVRMLAEGIEVIRALTGGGEPVHHEGEFYQVDGLLPMEAPTPPIWTGSMGPASLAVTGRLADGWVPPAAQDWRGEGFAKSRALIDKAAAEAGRDPAEITTIHHVWGVVTDSPVEKPRYVADNGVTMLDGTLEQWIEILVDGVHEHRAGGFVFTPVTESVEEGDRMRALWSREIVPAIRAALD